DFDQRTVEPAQLAHLLGQDVTASGRDRMDHRADLTHNSATDRWSTGREWLSGLRRDLGRGALDLSAQRGRTRRELLVAAVDLNHVADFRATLGGEGGDEHRHPGADVGALDAGAMKTARTADDRPMGIAKRDPSAHRDQLVDEEQAVLEHLLEDQDLALG